MEGDNADASRDSNAFGPVPLALLTGVVSYVVWPPWRARRIDSQVQAQVPAADTDSDTPGRRQEQPEAAGAAAGAAAETAA